MCFSELDRDGDGRVSFKDFDSAMKYNVNNHFWLNSLHSLCNDIDTLWPQ